MPYYLGLVASLYGGAGRVTEALSLLDEALATVSRTGECWFEAELHRLKGKALLKAAPEDSTEAEACYRRAIAVARKQDARHWELRAATSLARLWWNRGRCAEAPDYLAPVYSWYAEGFDTLDLKDAKELLEVLR